MKGCTIVKKQVDLQQRYTTVCQRPEWGAAASRRRLATAGRRPPADVFSSSARPLVALTLARAALGQAEVCAGDQQRDGQGHRRLHAEEGGQLRAQHHRPQRLSGVRLPVHLPALLPGGATALLLAVKATSCGCYAPSAGPGKYCKILGQMLALQHSDRWRS